MHKLLLDIPYQDQVSDILDFILTLKYINIVTSYFPPRISSRLDSEPSTCIFCMYISNANHCLISGLVVKVDHTSSTTDTGSRPDTHSKMVWFPETHLKCFTLQTFCVCVQHTHVHICLVWLRKDLACLCPTHTCTHVWFCKGKNGASLLCTYIMHGCNAVWLRYQIRYLNSGIDSRNILKEGMR